MALVVDRSAERLLHQAEFLQQLVHLGRIASWQGQVVGAQRAAHARHLMTAAVAAEIVFQFEQGNFVDTRPQEGAGASEARHACADDQDPASAQWAFSASR